MIKVTVKQGQFQMLPKFHFAFWETDANLDKRVSHTSHH